MFRGDLVDGVRTMSPRTTSTVLVPLALLALGACALPAPAPQPAAIAAPPAPRGLEADQTASAVPASVEEPDDGAAWKERMAQAYVFLERRGDYRLLGDTMRQLFLEADRWSLETVGPPFGLFYDDPGRVPTEELRARVCLPVAGRPDSPGALRYDVLPRAMVVYARVSGPYPEAPRVIPDLLESMERLGWSKGGPIREVYLVNPAVAEGGYEELVTEVQIPWGVSP
jgi:effector-binding domain-containing protein